MSIVQAAVGEHVKCFDDDSDIRAVWDFVSSHMTNSGSERAIVLMQGDGETFGLIWDAPQFLAHWSTPGRMSAHLRLVGFDCADEA